MMVRMNRPSAINEGCRLVVRDPALLLAELAWRWSFGLSALVLVGVSVYEVQRAVVVSPTDELLLRSMQPLLVAQAWSHLVQQIWPLMARVAAVLLPALTLMWIAAATFGRAVTLRNLVERAAAEEEIKAAHAETSSAAGGPDSSRGSEWRHRAATMGRTRWGALVALHSFRAAVGLSVVLGYIGSALIASRFVVVTDDAPQNIDLAMIVFVLVFSLVVMVASALNWVLALAPIFAVRDGRRTWESLREAVRMFRERGSQFTAVATVNGVLRFAAAGVASVAGLLPLTLLGEAPGWFVWGLVALVTLFYFVVSDWLLLTRMGAYVAVVERAAQEEFSLRPLESAQQS